MVAFVALVLGFTVFRPAPTPGPYARDFEAYYAAGAVWDAGGDPWSRDFPAPALSAGPKHFRVGVPKGAQQEFFGDGEAQAAFARDIAKLGALGATTSSV